MANNRPIPSGAIWFVLMVAVRAAVWLLTYRLAIALNLSEPLIWGMMVGFIVPSSIDASLAARKNRLGGLDLFRAKPKVIEALLLARQAAPCGPDGEWRAVGPDHKGDWRVVKIEELEKLDSSGTWREALAAFAQPEELRWRPYEDFPVIPFTAIGLAGAVLGLSLGPWWGALVMASSVGMVLAVWLGAAVHMAIGASSNHELEWAGLRLSSSSWEPEQAIRLDEPGLLAELRGQGESERLIVRQGQLKLDIPCWSPGYPALKERVLPPG